MAFIENESLLDRLDVQYNREGFSESYDDSYDDSESYDDSYDDSYDESFDDAEFLPIPVLGGLVNRGISAVNNLLSRGTSTRVNLTGVRPGAVNTSGITQPSNLAGVLSNAAGRQFQVRLPQNVATVESLNKVRQAIEAVNANVRKISETVNKNAQETAKIASEINKVDAKHTAASRSQNKVIARLNTQNDRFGRRVNTLGRSVTKLEKDLKAAQDQSRMMMLLPMLMNNEQELQSLTFNSAPAANQPVDVTATKYKSSDDNSSFLMLALAMGGFGGDSSSGGDSLMLPMLMMAMK